MTHYDDVIHLVSMSIEKPFKPVQLFSGHSGSDVALAAFPFLKDID